MMKAITQGYMATFREIIMNQAVLRLLSGKVRISSPEKSKNSTVYGVVNSLFEAEMNKEYIIKEIISDDKEIVNFLFTLGCFKGESVTVVSFLSETLVLSIKDARYSIDSDLAKTVMLVK